MTKSSKPQPNKTNFWWNCFKNPLDNTDNTGNWQELLNLKIKFNQVFRSVFSRHSVCTLWVTVCRGCLSCSLVNCFAVTHVTLLTCNSFNSQLLYNISNTGGWSVHHDHPLVGGRGWSVSGMVTWTEPSNIIICEFIRRTVSASRLNLRRRQRSLLVNWLAAVRTVAHL